jgi:hypothetical protein
VHFKSTYFPLLNQVNQGHDGQRIEYNERCLYTEKLTAMTYQGSEILTEFLLLVL